MAGARTQGVGRGVNWGAFGAMGQQYAEIGRTVERGASALGEGLGRGLSAIGGAIERKKVRQQQAAERQQERDYRAGRDTIQDARYEESNREQNALFEHQLFQEQMQSEYLQGRGPKAEMEDKQARVRNLGALLGNAEKMYQQTGDPAHQAEMVRAYQALQAELSGMGAGQAQAAPGAAPTPMASPSVPGTGPVMERPDAPPVNDVAMARDFFRKNGIEDRTIASPGLSGFSLRTPLGSIEGRLISRVRMAKDAQALEAAARMVNAMDDRTPIQRAAKSRARTLVTTANTDLAGRAEVLRIREERQRGMAVKQKEEEKIRDEQEGARILAGTDKQAILSGAGRYFSAEAAAARIRQIDADATGMSDSKRASDERRAAQLLTSDDPAAIIQGAGQGYSGEAAAAQVGRIREQERKQEEEAKREAEGRLKTRREVLSAVPAALEHRGVGADPMESFQMEDLATAFDSDLTDAQATAIGRHLVGRYDGDARSAAQAIYNAMPEQARTPAARERIRKALGLPPPKKKE